MENEWGGNEREEFGAAVLAIRAASAAKNATDGAFFHSHLLRATMQRAA